MRVSMQDLQNEINELKKNLKALKNRKFGTDNQVVKALDAVNKRLDKIESHLNIGE